MSSVNLYQSSGSSLFIKSDSKYDRWLQEHYLPSGFNIDLSKNRRSLKPFWNRRIRCDFGELCHLFSWVLLGIIILSTLIFCFYLNSECSLLNRAKVANTTTSLSASWHSKFQFLSLRITNQVSNKSEPNCGLVSLVVYLNLVFSYIFLVLLFCYIVHLVELTPDFAWYKLEIGYGTLYLVVLLVASLITCIATNATTIVLFTIFQMCLDAIFIILRYYKCQSGRPAQDLEEDPDGDYIRKMKYLFHQKEQKTTRAQKMRLFYSSKDGAPDELMCSKLESTPLFKKPTVGKEISSNMSSPKMIKQKPLEKVKEQSPRVTKLNNIKGSLVANQNKSLSQSQPSPVVKSKSKSDSESGSGSKPSGAVSSSSNRLQ